MAYFATDPKLGDARPTPGAGGGHGGREITVVELGISTWDVNRA